MIGITKGLHYLHSQGVVHGDLKSVSVVADSSCRYLLLPNNFLNQSNIIISPKLTPLLSDFGISQFVIANATQDDPTSTTGTTRWMAPELVDASQIYENPESKKKVDIWALGMVYLVSRVLLYESKQFFMYMYTARKF